MEASVVIRDTDRHVAVTMSRAQAERCLFALLERPYSRDVDEQEAAECFLIVQLRAALGSPVPADHWLAKHADAFA